MCPRVCGTYVIEYVWSLSGLARCTPRCRSRETGGRGPVSGHGMAGCDGPRRPPRGALQRPPPRTSPPRRRSVHGSRRRPRWRSTALPPRDACMRSSPARADLESFPGGLHLRPPRHIRFITRILHPKLYFTYYNTCHQLLYLLCKLPRLSRTAICALACGCYRPRDHECANMT